MARELQGGGSSPHRLALKMATQTIEEEGTYIVNDANKAKKTGKKNVRLAQSFLWSEIALNPNNSNYVFNVLDNVYNTGAPGLYPMERRLKQQDVFFTYKLGFYLLCTSTATGNTQYQFDLMTFPSANFGITPPFGVPIETLLGLWTSGTLNVTVNGDVLTPAWDLGQHLVIPETQIQVNAGPDAVYFDEKDLNEDGYVVVEPNWMVNGGNNNIYQVNYPNNFASILIGTNFQFHLVMKWQGFLAQNISSIMDMKG